MHYRYLLIALFFLYSCSQNTKTATQLIKVKQAWLDSIKNKADTSWTKPYRNIDFKTAEYYVDRKDSIVTQLMRDTMGTIRQISIAKYDNVRLFYAAYYPNGQLMAQLPMDSFGKYNGAAKLYYANGVLKSVGKYNHGFYSGEWKNFDSSAKYISTDAYDNNGQLIGSKH